MGFLNINTAGGLADYAQAPIPYARLAVYAAGTDRLSQVFRDIDLTVMRANPITADAAGEFDLCHVVDGDYRIVIETPDGKTALVQEDISVRSALSLGIAAGFRTVAELIRDRVMAYSGGLGRRKLRGGETVEVSEGGFRYRVAPAEADDAHLETSGGLKLYHVADPNGCWYLDALGARGDGVTDDQIFWQRALLHCPAGAKLTLTAGRTYLISAGNDFTNDSRNPGLSAAKSFHVLAYGATIRLKPFSGSELVHIFHNPGADGDGWKYEAWDFTWEGGTIDADGRNQNFRHAADLREGTGVVDAALSGNGIAEAYAAATAAVFGPGGAWPINPSSSSEVPTFGSGLVVAYGCRSFTVRDVTLRTLNEDGFVAYNLAGQARFENCRALDCIPTNDQFVISYVNAGVDPGSQAIAFKVERPRSLGILEYVQGDIAIAEGDTISGDQSGCVAVVSGVSGSAVRLQEIRGTSGFRPGETLTISGDASSSAVHAFRMTVVPNVTFDGLYGEVGNTLLGVLDTAGAQVGGVANVSNILAVDQGTAAMRFEHVHTLAISNATLRCSHLTSDPTKTLFFPSQAGINIGNDTGFVKIGNLSLFNCRLDGTGMSQELWECDSISVEVDDTDPLIHTDTGAASTINAIEASQGRLSNIRVRALPGQSGAYPIENALTMNLGSITDFEIDGCMNGLCAIEKASDGVIRNATNWAVKSAIALSGHMISFANVEVTDCAKGVNLSGSVAETDVTLDNVRFRRIAQTCVECADSDVALMRFMNCLFEDFGLDTGLSLGARAAITGNNGNGVIGNYLLMDGCVWRAMDPNCSRLMYKTQNGSEFIRERGTLLVPWNDAWTRTVSGATQKFINPVEGHTPGANTNSLPGAATHQIQLSGPDGVTYFVPAFSAAW